MSTGEEPRKIKIKKNMKFLTDSDFSPENQNSVTPKFNTKWKTLDSIFPSLHVENLANPYPKCTDHCIHSISEQPTDSGHCTPDGCEHNSKTLVKLWLVCPKTKIKYIQIKPWLRRDSKGKFWFNKALFNKYSVNPPKWADSEQRFNTLETAAGLPKKLNTNRINGSPFRFLPNCKDFNIDTTGFDGLALKYNLEKKLPPKLEIRPYNNYDLNKIFRIKILYIQRKAHSGDFDLAWSMCQTMMRTSTTLFISSLKNIKPHFHRDLSLETLIKLHQDVRKLAYFSHVKPIEYKRMYIKKANGKLRPLGVPTLEWRIYLHMLNNMLLILFSSQIPTWQHGFQPFKGTLSAWKELIPKILNTENIYEFDLKGFFDNVNLNYIKEELKNMMGNKHIIDKLNKPISIELDNKTNNWLYNSFSELNKELFEDNKQTAFPSLWNLMDWLNRSQPYNITETHLNELTKFNSKQHSLYDKVKQQNDYGVPQGSPCSPFLSLLVLTKFMKGKDTLMYADDGIWFSSNDNNINIPPSAYLSSSTGAHLNQQKSSWIRRDGKWLKVLKFLGLIYDPFKEEFRASTRKGSELILNASILSFLKEWDSYNPPLKITESERLKDIGSNINIETSKLLKLDNLVKEYNLINVSKSDLFGFITSRLYNGEWNSSVIQDFALRFNINSLCQILKDNWKIIPSTSEIIQDEEEIIKKEINLTAFNSTSYSTRLLYEILKNPCLYSISKYEYLKNLRIYRKWINGDFTKLKSKYLKKILKSKQTSFKNNIAFKDLLTSTTFNYKGEEISVF
jgi:Reverse transcriptase (RNA-dependent DNA polymerase)